MSADSGAFMFRCGERVQRQREASYTFPGVVLAAFRNTRGRKLYAVEHRTEVGMIHIFREADLRSSPEREELS